MVETIKINRQKPELDKIKYVADSIQNGGVIAYPTETVYGIGCDIFQENAVKRIFEIKSRTWNKPLNLIVSDKKMLEAAFGYAHHQHQHQS